MDPISPSQPQRIVLLIDLHPLLSLQNPKPYTLPILSAAKKLLSFPPLSSSLFAFKLFFSSLSPVLSLSKLHSLLPNPSLSLSFDSPLQTLHSLSQTLASIDLAALSPADPVSLPPTSALLALFLLRLEHDYAWEPHVRNPKGTPDLLTTRSNLILLFSPSSSGFFDLKNLEFDEFSEKFHRVFSPVNEKFVSRDIHFCWIDVNFDCQCEKDELGLGFFQRGIEELGWGFFSTDAIMLGSALVSFGLVFPSIACTMGFRLASDVNKGRAELVLGIADNRGEPLECKSCDLEVLDLRLLGEMSGFWHLFLKNHDGGRTKIRVKGVWRKEEIEEVIENSSSLVLLRGVSGNECRKGGSVEHSIKEFSVDSVLELVCTEKGRFTEEKPVWQLLLAFLFSRNYWASVSISDSEGNSLDGILKPFTIDYALLNILETKDLDSCRLVAFATSKTKDGRRKRNKMLKNFLQSVSWSSFYEAMLSQDEDIVGEMVLEELFLMKESKSKKLRFLKCWMKQIEKLSDYCETMPIELNESPNVNEERGERAVNSQQEPDLHDSASATEEAHFNGSLNKEASSFFCLEDLEAFIESIPQKIEQGLHSEKVDLWNLAERLVGFTIHVLDAKFGKKVAEESVVNDAEGASDVNIAAEVSRLLLIKPKDLVLKYKSFNAASVISEQKFIANKIREHELQILFRMEVFRSKIAERLEENVKQKMIKDICSLLQNIEFHLEGDSFCGESLLDFAGRTIKSRYANSLRDVIHKIYDQMEFFTFDGDEVDASDSLSVANSEELNKNEYEKDNSPKDVVGHTSRVSSSQTSAHLHDDRNTQQRVMENALEQRLTEAQARRDRSRRFSSFTSWVPDLQRRWALKQPKVEKVMHDSLPLTKSRRRKRRESASDMVCETPMTAKKHSHMEEGDRRGTEAANCHNNSCKSLSKALFHQ